MPQLRRAAVADGLWASARCSITSVHGADVHSRIPRPRGGALSVARSIDSGRVGRADVGGTASSGHAGRWPDAPRDRICRTCHARRNRLIRLRFQRVVCAAEACQDGLSLAVSRLEKSWVGQGTSCLNRSRTLRHSPSHRRRDGDSSVRAHDAVSSSSAVAGLELAKPRTRYAYASRIRVTHTRHAYASRIRVVYTCQPSTVHRIAHLGGHSSPWDS